MSVQPGPGGEQTAATPRCYRHADRETYVRCSRCDRFICPDCMVSASVGFQCPECVAEGNRAMSRGAFSGSGGQRARRSGPTFVTRVNARTGVVTYTLMGICIVAWVIQLANEAFTERFELIGITLSGSGEIGGVAGGEWWRLITAAFLHSNSPFHILFNMYALYLFGPPLEVAFGRVRFLTLYLLAAFGGCVASYSFSNPLQPSLGASGAIFGLLGAALVVSRRIGLDRTMLWVLIGLNVAIGFIATGIDWRAHFGGLVVGAAVAAIFAYAPASRRNLVQAAGCVLVFLILAGAAVVRTDQLGDNLIVRQVCGSAVDADQHRVCDG